MRLTHKNPNNDIYKRKLARYEDISENPVFLKYIKKAFDIMKNKEVDVHKFLDVQCLEHYNLGMIGAWKLTEKEYKLLRKALGL